MSLPTRSTKSGRRSVLIGLGGAGAAAALVSLVPASASRAGGDAAAETRSPSASGGYRLSEHVKRYYRSAKV